MVLRRGPIHIVNRMNLRQYNYFKEHAKHVLEKDHKPPEEFKEGPLLKTIGECFL